MMMQSDGHSAVERLTTAGLSDQEARAWLQAEAHPTTDFADDCTRFAAFWQESARLLARLPPPARRNEGERAAAQTIEDAARAARSRFLATHGEAVYDALTHGRTRFVRVEQLVTE